VWATLCVCVCVWGGGVSLVVQCSMGAVKPARCRARYELKTGVAGPGLRLLITYLSLSYLFHYELTSILASNPKQTVPLLHQKCCMVQSC